MGSLINISNFSKHKYGNKCHQFILGVFEKKLIGVMNIRSSAIHFYFPRKSYFILPRSVFPFEVELLNEGKAINMTTGVFRL